MTPEQKIAWVAEHCAPASCAIRAAQAQPGHRQAVHLLDVLDWLELAPGMAPEVLRDARPGDMRDLLELKRVRDQFWSSYYQQESARGGEHR